jgi:hypothetical protein
MAGGSNDEIVVRITAESASAGDTGGVGNTSRGQNAGGFSLALETLNTTLDKFDASLKSNTRALGKSAKATEASPDKQIEVARKVQEIREEGWRKRREMNDQFDRKKNERRKHTASQILEARTAVLKRDRQDALRNSLVSSSGIGASMIAGLLYSTGTTAGRSQAQYSLSNALVRPDIAYSQLFSSRFGAAQNVVGSLLMGGGALVGSMLGGLPGMVAGTVGGGAAAGLFNYLTSPIMAGENLHNTSQALQYANKYAYGGRFGSGLNNAEALQVASYPGGQAMSPQLQQLIAGATVGNQQLKAAYASMTGFFSSTGTGSMAPQVAPALMAAVRATGSGTNSKKLADLVDTLQEQLITTGQDPLSSLSTFSTLVSNSTDAGNINKALRDTFSSGMLSPVLQQANVGYLQSGPLAQWQQSMVASAAIPGFNLQRALAGDPSQIKRFRNFANSSLTNSFMANIAAGTQGYNALMGAPLENAQLKVVDAMAAQHAAYTKQFSEKGQLPSQTDLSTITDPLTLGVTKSAQSSEEAYTLYANTVHLITSGGTTAAHRADELLSAIHKDKS